MFLNNSYFKSFNKSKGGYTVQSNFTTSFWIPPLKPNNSKDYMFFSFHSIAWMRIAEKTFSIIDTSLRGGFFINAILAVVLGASMRRMWSLINTLQILTMIPELGFEIPTNLVVCLEKIREVSNMNIFPESWGQKLKSLFKIES